MCTPSQTPASAKSAISTEDFADSTLDISLRPKKLVDFVGQEKIKNNLSLSIQAAKQRNESLGHTLFYGPPGLGKTTLAHIISKEMSANIRTTAGPAIERAGDLAAILTNLEPGDILFIDEIHRLNKTIEEILYPAMEDSALDIVVGKGPSARTLRLELPSFTLIGATTKLSMISAPLRDRFNGIWRLEFYTHDDLRQIALRSADILRINLKEDAAKEVASRARRTPRIANRLLRHVRDVAQVRNQEEIDAQVCRESLKLLEIDSLGLDETDRALLTTIIERFNGGPAGLSTLSAATGEDHSTIEEVYEPYLMQIGFLSRTPRGRMATPAAYEHLGKKVPANLQEKLL